MESVDREERTLMAMGGDRTPGSARMSNDYLSLSGFGLQTRDSIHPHPATHRLRSAGAASHFHPVFQIDVVAPSCRRDVSCSGETDARHICLAGRRGSVLDRAEGCSSRDSLSCLAVGDEDSDGPLCWLGGWWPAAHDACIQVVPCLKLKGKAWSEGRQRSPQRGMAGAYPVAPCSACHVDNL